MGVTVHFEGRLRGSADLANLERIVRDFAHSHSWPIREIREQTIVLKRVRNEDPWNYTGATTGIELLPHANCEPLRLEFDNDLYVQEYVKTQYAPSEVHIAVIELLHKVRPYFETIEVDDEGEYFETGELARKATSR